MCIRHTIQNIIITKLLLIPIPQTTSHLTISPSQSHHNNNINNYHNQTFSNMVQTTPAFASPMISIGVRGHTGKSLHSTPPFRTTTRNLSIQPHRYSFTSLAAASPEANDVGSTVTVTPTTNDTLDTSNSAIQSIDDVNELISLASEFNLADLKVSDHGVEVCITRPGGRGFDAEGQLADIPTSASVQPTVSETSSFSPSLQAPPPTEVVKTEETKKKVVEKEKVDMKDADPDLQFDSDFMVTSNRVGFFFSGAKNKPPLVNVGDHVAFNQPVCIIEQLGQQYVYLSEASGTVNQIFVEDGDAVEFGQQIMVIRPD